MKLSAIITLILLSGWNCFAQVDPSTIVPPLEFHEHAVGVESDRQVHLLDIEAFIKMLQSPEHKVIIDLRGDYSFRGKHIKGAINLPMEELTEKNLKRIAPDLKTPIIVYCDNSFFPTRMIGLTTYAYPTLRKFGYENVFDIEPLWRKSVDTPKELEPFWETSK